MGRNSRKQPYRTPEAPSVDSLMSMYKEIRPRPIPHGSRPPAMYIDVPVTVTEENWRHPLALLRACGVDAPEGVAEAQRWLDEIAKESEANGQP